MLIGSGIIIGSGITIRSTLISARVNAVASQLLEVGVPLFNFTPVTVIDETGTGPYLYVVVSGTLPDGIALNSITGEVTGIPYNPYDFSTVVFGVQDVNGTLATQTNSVNFVVYPSTTAAAFPIPQILEVGYAMTPYQPLVALGGTGSYTYSILSGTLPAGLTYNPVNGRITGTPLTAQSSTSVTFTVRDSYNVVAPTTATTTFFVYPAITATAVTTTQRVEVGSPVTPFTPLTAASGSGEYTYFVSPGFSLPPGLSIDPNTGVVSGTPTSATFGTASVRFGVRDSIGATAATTSTVTYTVFPTITATVNAITQELQVGVPMTAYKPLSANNGSGTYTYFISAGSLPPGVSLNTSTGFVSGTPTNLYNTSSVTFSVRDSLNVIAANTATVNFTVFPAITATTNVVNQNLNVGLAMIPFTPITAAGGTGIYTYYVGSGILPAGLTLNASTGLVSGTPTTPYSSSNITFRVRDTIGISSVVSTVSFRVNAATTATATNLVAQTLEVGTAMVPFTPLTAANGTGIYTYSIISGTLPAGLTLNTSTGQVSGTPTTPYIPANVRFAVQDSLGVAASTTVNIAFTVFDRITAVSSAADYLFEKDLPITPFVPLTAASGSGVYTYFVSSGTLPTGLTLDSVTGVVSGTPTVFSLNTVVFSVRDSLNVVASTTSSVTMTVDFPVVATASTQTTQTLEAQISMSGFNPLFADGGNGIFVYSVSSGTLPTGLSLNQSTGQVTGIPTVAGSSTVTFRVRDSLNVFAPTTATITFVVNPTITATTTPFTQILVVGYPMNNYQPLTASLGQTPYTYYVNSGSLPAGLSLNSVTGTISGTPTTASTTSFTIAVRDNLSRIASTTALVSMTVYPVITATPTGIVTQQFEVGQTISFQTFSSVTGGTGTYTYFVQGGFLPGGLTLNASTGVVSGTLTQAENQNVTFGVRDSANITAANTSSIAITVFPRITATAATSGTLNAVQYTPISQFTPVYNAQGGNGVYTYYISSGTLPTGLALNSVTGLVLGAPKVNGTFNVTFAVRDGLGVTAAQACTITFAIDTVVIPMDYLIVGAGGGGGGSQYNPSPVVYGGNGGGGGGQVAENIFNIPSGMGTMNVTVGGGGAGGFGYTSPYGGTGGNSGITVPANPYYNVTSRGGSGGAGRGATPGNNFLSSPGQAGFTAGAGGASGGLRYSGQPVYGYWPAPGAPGTQPSGASPGYGGGGGGGGAGSAGSDGQAVTINGGGVGGAGGSGVVSPLSGVAHSYGGQGGHATIYGGAGGGSGPNNTRTGGDGGPRGSGGGGGAYDGAGGSGAPGIVVLRIPQGYFSEIYTGSVSTYASGGYQYITFNGSGSYKL